MKRVRSLPATVLVLGLVSLLTDVSSEMIYPLLPLFLTTALGAGPAFLGVIEGVAESTAALTKLGAGMAADRFPKRKPLVVAGYGLSSLARPLVAFAATPLQVLAIRFVDRTGKGIRTSPRDALLAAGLAPSLRGLAFGFHRSMDHAGALLGPLLAAALMGFWGVPLRSVFFLAAVPGLLAVLLLAAGVREAAADGRLQLQRVPGRLPAGPFRRYLLALLVFTLGNSADAFLLLKATAAGIPAAQLPLLWAGFHLVKMATATPGGGLSDRLGRRTVIVAGWGVYALAYGGFALAGRPWQIWGLFAVYGLFYGLTEGAEKALVADLSPAAELGSSFGWYHCTVGIGALPASLLFGLIWQRAGSGAAFATGAALAGVAALLLTGLPSGEATPARSAG